MNLSPDTSRELAEKAGLLNPKLRPLLQGKTLSVRDLGREVLVVGWSRTKHKVLLKIGSRYGTMTITDISRTRINPAKQLLIYYYCVCDCGASAQKEISDLRRRDKYGIKCPGCTPRIKHRMSGTQVYRVWATMKDRCYSKTCKKYSIYGGRGIKICKRWLDSFECFFGDMGPRPAGMSIERINNNGDYEPGNCKWATSREQSANTRKNRHITHNGQTMILSDWARNVGISASLISTRIIRGWDPAIAATTPKTKRSHA